MIICDWCRKELGAERWAMTLTIGGSAMVLTSQPIELVHACSKACWALSLVRTARRHIESFGMDEGVRIAARSELARSEFDGTAGCDTCDSLHPNADGVKCVLPAGHNGDHAARGLYWGDR